MTNENSSITRSRQKHMAEAKHMPPLRHTQPDKPFDICNSAVVDWLCSQPCIREYIFDLARKGSNIGVGYIEYDVITKTWQGIDYEKPASEKPATENEDWLQACGLSRQF